MTLALIMCSCHDNKISECVVTPPTIKVVEKCDILENYLMDVVDETDFWETCDSTAFNMYEENSPEWMLQVIIEYTREIMQL